MCTLGALRQCMWFVFYSNVLYVCFGCSDSACGLCFTVMYCMCALGAQTVHVVCVLQ